MRSILCLFAGLVLFAGGMPQAQGAGMFVTPHGARPLGRGGAFVAGADDLNAIYYNPVRLCSFNNPIIP